jgi:AcrR family transcriptional regulator
MVAKGHVMARTAVKASARERLLDAADELFYREGVQTVGIDRVIEHAGVAKASLYNTFGSKDELIRAYLESRHERTAARIARHMDKYTAPRARLLAVFEAQAETIATPGFRGSAFVAASAEARPGSAADQASKNFRAWVRELFTRLATEAGAPRPVVLAKQLQMIYDGSGIAARSDQDTGAAIAARAAAGALLDAALA